MSKYLKKFKTHTEYQTYINGSDKVLPNISYCEDAKDVHLNPYICIIVKYNVIDDSEPIQLYPYGGSVSGLLMFENINIDGEDISISDIDTTEGKYQLSIGEHIVKYVPINKTLIGSKDEQTTEFGAAFLNCPNIVSIKLPRTINNIG